MKLSEQQIRFFNTFGYLLMPKLFSSTEIAAIADGFETSLAKDVGIDGKCGNGKPMRMIFGPIEHTPEMCAILDDPRILGLIGGVIGEDFNYCTGDGSVKSGDTWWHPDGNWGEVFAIKVAIYLDPVRRDSGALRVVPGSQDPQHLLRRLKLDPNKSKEQLGAEPRDFPGNVSLDSDPGDVVIFNHDTYHSAWGGGDRRRMFTLNCTRHAHDERTLGMLRSYLKVHSASGHGTDTHSGMFYPTMRETAGPERMRHLEQPDQIHDEVHPHRARNRLQPV